MKKPDKGRQMPLNIQKLNKDYIKIAQLVSENCGKDRLFDGMWLQKKCVPGTFGFAYKVGVNLSSYEDRMGVDGSGNPLPWSKLRRGAPHENGGMQQELYARHLQWHQIPGFEEYGMEMSSDAEYEKYWREYPGATEEDKNRIKAHLAIRNVTTLNAKLKEFGCAAFIEMAAKDLGIQKDIDILMDGEQDFRRGIDVQVIRRSDEISILRLHCRAGHNSKKASTDRRKARHYKWNQRVDLEVIYDGFNDDHQVLIYPNQNVMKDINDILVERVINYNMMKDV